MFWAATSDGGLNSFNPKSLRFNLFHTSLKNADEKTTCIGYDNSLNFFVGTKDEGLIIYNSKNGVASHFQNEKNNQHSISSNKINCIYKDKNGNKIDLILDNTHINHSEKCRPIFFRIYPDKRS